MSTAAKVTLGTSMIFTVCTTTFVITQHYAEKENLRKGVLRDIERQEKKKRNKDLFDQSKKLEESIKQQQRLQKENDS